MKRNRMGLLISVLITILLIAFPVLAEDENIYRTNFNSGDIPTIDQSLVSDFVGIQLADEMTVGLLRQNEETGELDPGMATEWTASEDKLVYTFKLLEGIPWVKYNPDTDAVEEVKDCDGNIRYVTAKDFVTVLNELSARLPLPIMHFWSISP